MIDRLYNKINQISNGKSLTVLLTLSLLLMVVVNLINLPITVPRINELSNGAGILDAKLYYTSIEAYQVLDAQQPAGRQVYLKFFTMFDSIFPLIYSLALAVIITVIFRLAFPSASWFQKLSLVPFIVGMLDYLENAAIITMLIKYPVHVDIASIAGYFTLGKWVFSWFSLLLIVLGLMRLLWIRVRLKCDA